MSEFTSESDPLPLSKTLLADTGVLRFRMLLHQWVTKDLHKAFAASLPLSAWGHHYNLVRHWRLKNCVVTGQHTVIHSESSVC